MSLSELFQVLKGGPTSGNRGHAGIPGHRGGSTSKGGSSSSSGSNLLGVGTLKEKYGFNSYRQEMIDKFQKEIFQGLDSAGVKLSDLKELYIYGSFASKKAKPGDMDVMAVVSGNLPKGENFTGPGVSGKYDANSWGAGHTVSLLLVNDKKMAQTQLQDIEFEAKGDYDKPFKIWG